MHPLTVLLVHHDHSALAELRDAVRPAETVRVIAAKTGADALVRATRDQPDGIFCSHELPDLHPVELCRRIKESPDLEDATFVMTSNESAEHNSINLLEHGIDGLLREPFIEAEVLSAVHGIAKVKALQLRLEHVRDERRGLQDAVNRTFDPVIDLLAHLVKLGVPGAAERASLIVSLSQKLATRFEIPKHWHRGLVVAARLHEIGRVAVRHSGVEQSSAQWAEEEPLFYTVASYAIMKRIKALQEPADLVSAIPENWDGTGKPDRRQRGQIPLRSRILRVLIDFAGLHSVQRSSNAAATVRLMAAHSGTWYDPLVITHLDEIVATSGDRDLTPSRSLVPVAELAEGMILAEDLVTSSGIKLLGRDATITGEILHAIQRRHALDPVLEGAYVRR